MADMMDYAQMVKHFNKEWVLIADPEISPRFDKIRGTELFH